MRLSSGTRVGHYEVIGSLGAGGMGEVYRARDSRLNRDVAIKALPDALSSEPDRVSRFEREAQLLAALNHPNIAQVFGVVDLVSDAGSHSMGLVLELVEGGTLGDRLKTGPLPLRETLRVARDIADGLSSAHDQGIIHRDLKPDNIALTPGGKPKILDFGLAKAFTAVSDGTTLGGATGIGVVLGTAPYMSPEQTRGLPVDKRSDIWSFGCVLYQMLTGRNPFVGQTTSDIVVAILQHEPDLDALPMTTPARVRWLLRRCLEKDPANRLHDVADARIELDEALAHPESPSGVSTPPAGPAARRGVTRERAAWIVAALAVVGMIAALLSTRRSSVEAVPAFYRASIVLPDDLRLLALDPAARFALSPDGKRLALVALNDGGVPILWVRPLDSLAVQPIAGTEGASYPFWSPDSASIGFTARPTNASLGPQAKLKKVDLTAGQVVTLADAMFSASGAWNRDNVILFTPEGNAPLSRVAASGGSAPVAVTRLDTTIGDVQHSYPAFLPDGRHFLYTALGSPTSANAARALYIGSLDSSESPRLLLEGGSNAKYANGYLVFLRRGTLFAQRFDVDSLTLEGEAVPIAERVLTSGSGTSGGAAAFSVSETGVLVYQTGLLVRSQLAWMDQKGKPIALLGEHGDYADVAVSPDGSRAVVSMLDTQAGTRDLCIFDVPRGGVCERFTSEPSDDFAPVWSPGGDRIAFTSVRKGSIEIYERSASGSGGERMLEAGDPALGKFAASWSPDGEALLFIAGGRALARSDIHVMSMSKGGKASPFVNSRFVETQARFSPDGRWIAYVTNEYGNRDVYVRRFAGQGEKPQRVSSGGGGWPQWARDGKQLFFLSLDETKLMSVAVSAEGSSLKIGNPRTLFDVRLRPFDRLDGYPYDVAPDGRFLLNTLVADASSAGLTVVINWPQPLR
jgi:Tol biopolymer transport system component